MMPFQPYPTAWPVLSRSVADPNPYMLGSDLLTPIYKTRHSQDPSHQKSSTSNEEPEKPLPLRPGIPNMFYICNHTDRYRDHNSGGYFRLILKMAVSSRVCSFLSFSYLSSLLFSHPSLWSFSYISQHPPIPIPSLFRSA